MQIITRPSLHVLFFALLYSEAATSSNRPFALDPAFGVFSDSVKSFPDDESDLMKLPIEEVDLELLSKRLPLASTVHFTTAKPPEPKPDPSLALKVVDNLMEKKLSVIAAQNTEQMKQLKLLSDADNAMREKHYRESNAIAENLKTISQGFKRDNENKGVEHRNYLSVASPVTQDKIDKIVLYDSRDLDLLQKKRALLLQNKHDPDIPSFSSSQQEITGQPVEIPKMTELDIVTMKKHMEQKANEYSDLKFPSPQMFTTLMRETNQYLVKNCNLDSIVTMQLLVEQFLPEYVKTEFLPKLMSN